MAFAARLPEDLDHWLDETAQHERRSKNAIVVAALEEYRQRRDMAHVLELARKTNRDHAGLIERLGDA
ncbi:hypothetical protein [Nocardia mexicana]|uniref:Ribbon-helix-helix CopG family protein n=1 Tax=Nocardia mexicana TaxID=279262 RepID=A0A370HD77_9NOCA|nr:hypothetical protein [Nocardia mexicana]RDI54355.1 hypothetical protein DFR68_102480 [Nocardia mexicana]